MRTLFFLTLIFISEAHGQVASNPEVKKEKKEVKLVRAVDDRAKLIRQRRDLLDLKEKTQVHTKASVNRN